VIFVTINLQAFSLPRYFLKRIDMDILIDILMDMLIEKLISSKSSHRQDLQSPDQTPKYNTEHTSSDVQTMSLQVQPLGFSGMP
jgi:hypothetical protein